MRGEQRRWQGCRDSQQWRREHRPDKAREEDVERQRYPRDLSHSKSRNIAGLEVV